MSFSQFELVFHGLKRTILAFRSIDKIACEESGMQFKPIELRIMTYAKNDLSYLLATVHKIFWTCVSFRWCQLGYKKIIPNGLSLSIRQ